MSLFGKGKRGSYLQQESLAEASRRMHIHSLFIY